MGKAHFFDVSMRVFSEIPRPQEHQPNGWVVPWMNSNSQQTKGWEYNSLVEHLLRLPWRGVRVMTQSQGSCLELANEELNTQFSGRALV